MTSIHGHSPCSQSPGYTEKQKQWHHVKSENNPLYAILRGVPLTSGSIILVDRSKMAPKSQKLSPKINEL